MDRVIQDTFNAFWSIRFGKETKELDYRMFQMLSRANGAGETLKAAMKDIIAGFKPYLEKEDEFTQADWLEMLDMANGLYKKYVYDHRIFPVIAETLDYIDRRETKKYANGSTNH